MVFDKINKELEIVRERFSMDLVNELQEIHNDCNYKVEIIEKMFKR